VEATLIKVTHIS